MERQIIARAHDRGHFAVKKTKEMIYNEYKFIDCCIPCILTNRKRGKQEGWLHPLHKEDFSLHTYHIDFLGLQARITNTYSPSPIFLRSSAGFILQSQPKSLQSYEDKVKCLVTQLVSFQIEVKLS